MRDMVRLFILLCASPVFLQHESTQHNVSSVFFDPHRQSTNPLAAISFRFPIRLPENVVKIFFCMSTALKIPIDLFDFPLLANTEVP